MKLSFTLLLTIFIRGLSAKIIKIGPCTLAISPETCNSTYTQFYLYTRNSKERGEVVSFVKDSDNLTSSKFDSKLENKFIIHGYNADMNLSALQDIKSEYLKQGDYNVWMLNWSPLCTGVCYPAAVHNVEHVGRCLKIAINRLRAATKAKLKLHVIGFSLGAHVPAVAAIHLKPYIIPRVTGLDPAMPGFIVVDRRKRLSKKSGRYVDVIHTNGMVQGLIEALGHSDFYMNGGITQPGCFQANLLESINCDHVRSPVYFAESINSETGFWGWKCNDLFYLVGLCKERKGIPTLMGEHVLNSTRGSYVVKTNAQSPYAKGKWRSTKSRNQ